jgi:hypothetical protein
MKCDGVSDDIEVHCYPDDGQVTLTCGTEAFARVWSPRPGRLVPRRRFGWAGPARAARVWGCRVCAAVRFRHRDRHDCWLGAVTKTLNWAL